jgi:hypothetical protein
VSDIAVDERQLVGQEVVDPRMRVAVIEHARDGLAGAGCGVQRAPVLAQARVGLDGLGRGHGVEVAATHVQHQPQAEERLDAPAEARLGAAHALGDRADAPVVGRVEVQDAVGLAVADRSQHDRVGL